MRSIVLDLIIYDLDGTLVDSLADIADSVNRTLARFGLPPLPPDEVRRHVGAGARHLIRALVPPTASFEEIFGFFLTDYDQHLLDKTTLYPGVATTLAHFSDRRQAVLSNKPTNLSVKILKGLKVDHFFSAVLGGDAGFPLKPDPAAILQLLNEFKIEAARALIVGDSPVDIKAGTKAGIKTCAVTYGLRDKAELIAAQPDLIIDTMDTLQQRVR